MSLSFKILCTSILSIFFAWVLKLHFLPFGDFLFRIGTLGITVSLLVQLIIMLKEGSAERRHLRAIFLFNTATLLIVYIGMMLKVAHVMTTQLQKDFLLDFIGLPAICFALLYTFSNSARIAQASSSMKLLFLKHIVLPWLMFIFSFLLYAIYSVILSLQRF